MEPGSPIMMVHHALGDVPQHALPAGYVLRWYQPGDVRHWVRIQAAADRYNTITPALFTEAFGHDEAEIGQRQCYLLDPDGQPVGTATAWYGSPRMGTDWGRIHWVAIVPACQGQGLAKPLMTATCNRLHRLGHRRAYLTTATIRYPAIALYHRFGFLPAKTTAADEAAWRPLEARLRDGFRA